MNYRCSFLPVQIIVTLSLLLITASCKQPKPDDGKTYNPTIETGAIPGIKAFASLDQTEEYLVRMYDSLNKETPESPGFKDRFKNNRSRIYFAPYPDNRPFSGDEKLTTKGMSAQCQCMVNNDSLYVSTAVGFFGGAGFNIEIFKDSFTSRFFLYTDDVKPYKSHLSDTGFADHAIAASKYQYLVLEDKPTYQPGQQITGLLTYTSNRFYERKAGDILDSTFVSGKLYFTCHTLQSNGAWKIGY